jgi:hypothetical protein
MATRIIMMRSERKSSSAGTYRSPI